LVNLEAAALSPSAFSKLDDEARGRPIVWHVDHAARGDGMAGYSGTPLPKKLGIKPKHRVTLVNAPPWFPDILHPLPEGVAVFTDLRGRGPFDVILFFVDDLASLRAKFARIAKRLSRAGGLWVAWPKQASGVPTDVTENVARTVGLAAGLVDNKVCAIDETWSGLRFVYRLQDRAAPPS
jgi:hypothetical protein